MPVLLLRAVPHCFCRRCFASCRFRCRRRSAGDRHISWSNGRRSAVAAISSIHKPRLAQKLFAILLRVHEKFFAIDDHVKNRRPAGIIAFVQKRRRNRCRAARPRSPVLPAVRALPRRWQVHRPVDSARFLAVIIADDQMRSVQAQVGQRSAASPARSARIRSSSCASP